MTKRNVIVKTIYPFGSRLCSIFYYGNVIPGEGRQLRLTEVVLVRNINNVICFLSAALSRPHHSYDSPLHIHTDPLPFLAPADPDDNWNGNCGVIVARRLKWFGMPRTCDT